MFSYKDLNYYPNYYTRRLYFEEVETPYSGRSKSSGWSIYQTLRFYISIGTRISQSIGSIHQAKHGIFH